MNNGEKMDQDKDASINEEIGVKASGRIAS